MRFGTPHRHFQSTDSTNERARDLAAEGAESGTVITAAEQRDGRGRHGRTWVAPFGKALLYSAILRDPKQLQLLPLAAAVATSEAAESLAPDIVCGVKWPNDVRVEDRKVAGILIEARPGEWAVIGVGLNLTIAPEEFPEEFRDDAASLGTVADGVEAASLSPEAARAALDEALGRWVDASAEDILDAWRGRDLLEGREISWDGGSGVAAGIDARGNLVVTLPGGGRTTLAAGEVHLVRPV
jgi:BirA family biotin operon repressor/biotin-[acetyl-CoA-carboxylase] ligase